LDNLLIPYYENSLVKIYHGNCEEILPQLDTVDLILTDPPYGINENDKKVASREKLADPKDYGNFSWDKQPISQELFDYIIERGNYSCIFGGNYYNTKKRVVG